MKSRKPLQRGQRHYLADLSFYFALNTDNRSGIVPENVTELIGKGETLGVT